MNGKCLRVVFFWTIVVDENNRSILRWFEVLVTETIVFGVIPIRFFAFVVVVLGTVSVFILIGGRVIILIDTSSESNPDASPEEAECLPTCRCRSSSSSLLDRTVEMFFP